MKNAKKLAKAIVEKIVELRKNETFDLLSLDEMRTVIADVIQAHLPTSEQERIERASHYLCDSDELTMAEQLALIDAQAEIDPTMMLDNVEGVIVWQKVEYSFTVEDFLSEIDK